MEWGLEPCRDRCSGITLCIKHAAKAGVLLLALLLAGCTSYERMPVEGSVTFDGAPVDGGHILFVPETNGSKQTHLTSGSARIMDGKYALSGPKGLYPGSYNVLITWKRKTGQKIVVHDEGPPVDELLQVIPAEYNSETTLKAEVTAKNNNTFDFTLQSK